VNTFGIPIIRSTFAILLVLLAAPAPARPLAAQAHGEEHHQGHAAGLHFAHPLIAESVSPDTKIRLDYRFRDLEGGERNTVAVEGEYAFHRAFSIEVGIPYTSLDREEMPDGSSLGNTEVALKFANYAFEERGLLLGYGIEFGLPTGDDEEGIGSDHIVDIEPFLNAGYKRGGLETVAFATFGIPTNQRPEEVVETELGYNLSLLYHVGSRLQALLELDGESILSNEEGEEQTTLNLTPGLKVRPLAGQNLLVGIGVGVPLAEDQEFDTRVIISAFYHFR
jgi:hypothetical protein